jgi:hypothetical protein
MSDIVEIVFMSTFVVGRRKAPPCGRQVQGKQRVAMFKWMSLPSLLILATHYAITIYIIVHKVWYSSLFTARLPPLFSLSELPR